MMAATTANTPLTSTSGSSAAGDAIASNSQGSGSHTFGQSLAQAESASPNQEGRLPSVTTPQTSPTVTNEQTLASLIAGDLAELTAEELVSEESSLAQSESQTEAEMSMLLNEQSIREGGAVPVSHLMQNAQQKSVSDSPLSEAAALKSQSAVSAVDASEGKAQRVAATTIGASESKSQFSAQNASLLQRESVSSSASELLSRSKVQVTQDIKLSAVNDAAQVRTTSQELTFKAELAMNSSNKAEVGQRLVSMLSDKITLQASSQANKATIRLDPPELGKIDLTVTLERDRLSVQINTSNASVREAITQTVERLRAELVQENFLEVTVNIGNDENSGSSQSEHVQDDALTQIASNFSAAEEQAEAHVDQEQEIIARV